ncbi:MAG: hypothetical protein CVT63_04030 [Candidatus Anoxymicrobium japonicum]|uniref:DUF58 domain-containing protein n=1 Tax=Candidatus Anoxymicrobium japonicum TaxID=2013648 RepID=A0A2N3G6F0_9ACTN|nr:MAG: hypothetical protein CVT63_04030 [Candidatus Anoxymicrobium japonicum]
MTKRSLVTALVGLALLLIASSIKSGWLYLVASVLFSLLLVDILAGWRATRKLDVCRSMSARVFEGDPFSVLIRVSNTGSAGRRLLTVKDLLFKGKGSDAPGNRMRSHRAEFKEFLRTGNAVDARGRARDSSVKTIAFEYVPGHTGVDASYEMVAPRRGVYGPAEMSVSSGGVFGSASIRRRTSTGERLIVFPRISPVDSSYFNAHVSPVPVESIEWSRKGIGQNYYGTREYSRGDSLRHIHWRSSARRGTLIVKEYEQELKPFVALAVALWPPVFGDENHNSMEDGLRAAASIVSFYESMGHLPLLVLPDGNAFESVEAFTLFGCLETLASYKPPAPLIKSRAEKAVVKVLETTRELMPPGQPLVLVTNAPPESVAEALESFGDCLAGSLVLALDGAYGPRWEEEWPYEAPWLARFTGLPFTLYAITSDREIGRCLSESLSTIAL